MRSGEGSALTLLLRGDDVLEEVDRDLLVRGQVEAHVHGEEVVHLALAPARNKGCTMNMI